jgi:excinuclease UvrABC ATPase subunit
MFAKKFSKDKRFFSNLTGNDGMCPVCKGAGYIEYGSDKNILRLECKECEGTGFNKDLKKYKIEGKSIFYVWKMTISEALSCNNFFDEEIINILRNASYIMVDHLRIGQPTSTLSGGENIRIKILKSSKNTANVLGIDEPFKGLSKTEIYRMVKYLNSIRDSGKTIIVIDHTDKVDRFFSKKIVLSNKDNKLIGN